MSGRYVFDAETDNLLLACTRCWIIAAKDLDTGLMRYWLEGDLGWQQVFWEADLLVGHNILGFDIPVFEKLFGGWKPNKKTRLEDTQILSQVLNYKRFGSRGHSLEVWGDHLKFPKVVHEDWSQYSEEMKNRCLTDVELNTKVWDILKKEAQENVAKKEYIRTYISAEKAATVWNAQSSLHGWPFDLKSAIPLLAKMKEEMDAAHTALSHKLGSKTVAVDKKLGIVEVKSPAWTKKGEYATRTCEWFNVPAYTGSEGFQRMIEGDYCRVLFEPLDLDSVQDVKVFLFRNGWEPTEWNTKRVPDPKRPERMIIERTSPKVTEDSLEFLGGDGKLYCDFLSTKSRYGVLKTWIEAVDDNGNLHGDAMCIGTPSMRARHSLIVNVPAVDSTWGKEMRSLFVCKPGWKLIGCDSAGNQARGLAHYLQSDEYVKLLLEGDIHQYNADKLTEVLAGMNVTHKVPRARAKRILYAFLFGASGAKLWGYIFDIQDKEKGNKLKNGFQKAVPGLKTLLETLEKIFASTRKFGDGYIPGIAGNRIYCDSFHKLLVYLLQACEKATCSTALMITMQKLEEENIPYQPCIYYHDEIDFMVPEQYALRAAAIGKQAFVDGPKMYGITIMDGEAKIGNNWYEVH
jgi:DNA polymerase-1